MSITIEIPTDLLPAYRGGVKARRLGKSRHSCQFYEKTPEQEYWLLGYDEAEAVIDQVELILEQQQKVVALLKIISNQLVSDIAPAISRFAEEVTKVTETLGAIVAEAEHKDD